MSDEASSYSDLVRENEVPALYKQRMARVIPNVAAITNFHIKDFGIAVGNYSRQKGAWTKNDLPRLIGLSDLTDSFAYEQSVFLRQGLEFATVASSVDEASKPILLYYSASMLHSFFSGSMFRFDNLAPRHGISMKYAASIPDIALTIDSSGKFSRIVDTYSLLGCDSRFSPLTANRDWDGTGEFRLTEKPLSYARRPALSLPDLVKLRDEISWDLSTTRPSLGFERDLIDYLLLFVASNLARYRPYLWKQALDGISVSYVKQFRAAMERVAILAKRLVYAFEAAYCGDYIMYPLHAPDIHIESVNSYHGSAFYESEWRKTSDAARRRDLG